MDILVENSTYNGTYQYGSTNYAYVFDPGGNENFYGITTTPPYRYWKTQWHEINRSYYNPRVQYRPWPGKNDASTTNPLRDPVISTGTFNLNDTYNSSYGVIIKNAHYYIRDDNGNIYLVNFNSGLRQYYLFTDSDGDDMIDLGEFTSLGTKPDSLAGIIPDTDSEDLQNFANWFSYYRRREQAAKNAVSRAIRGLDGVRVGYQYISQYASTGLSVTPKFVQVNVDGVLQDETDVLLDALYAIDSQSPVGTTLRGGLKRAGEYLKSGAPYYPADNGGECQQSFAIVVTDGYWNDYDSSFISSTDYDGDGHSKTLADVAYYYYDIDLISTLADLVPTNSNDSNNRQHMVTYGLAFGVKGTLNQDTIPSSWPVIEPDEPTTIDDLWHATINGKGEFLNASSPDELTVALQLLIQNIENRLGSGASVSINGEKIFDASKIYQSSYSSDGWTGDVRAYSIDSEGNVNKGSDVYIWSARGKLESKDWDTGRRIATFNGSTGIAFRYTSLSDVQKAQLPEDKVNYIRGDDSNEQNSGGIFRDRSYKLGDIVHSIPVFYEDYLYVGANDGMLHALDAFDGEEIFAYVPNLVFSNLGELTDPSYTHKYYVDNSPFVRSIGSTTLLVSGLGRGGKGYFCLDVTNTETNTEDNADSWVKWEYPDLSTPDEEKNDLGYSFSRATIVNSNAGWVVIFGNGYVSPNGNAVLFVLDAATGTKLAQIDTGVGECNGLSTPAVVDVDNDYIVDYVYAGDLKGNLWKFDLTGSTAASWEVAYKDGTTPKPLFQAKNAAGIPQPITAKPDVMRYCDPEKPGYLVFFGTGKHLANSDLTNTDTQTIYGIWDYGDDSDNAEYLGSFERPGLSNMPGVTLLAQTEVAAVINPNASNDFELRVLSDNRGVWLTEEDETPDEQPNPTVYAGWYFDLPDTYEKVIRDVIVRDLKLIAVSFIPIDSPCSAGGESHLHEMNACYGGRLDNAQFDISGDGYIDDNDLINITVEVPDPENPGQTIIETISVAPTAIKYPAMIYEPVIIAISGDREVKYSSDSTGGIRVLREKQEKRGVYNWREID